MLLDKSGNLGGAVASCDVGSLGFFDLGLKGSKGYSGLSDNILVILLVLWFPVFPQYSQVINCIVSSDTLDRKLSNADSGNECSS